MNKTLPTPTDYFTKISDLDAKLQIANDLLRLKAIVFCKGTDSEIYFKLEIKKLSSSHHLMAVLVPGEEKPNPLPRSCTVSMSVGKEKYFLSTQITELENHLYEIDYSPAIYHLQRRENFRVRILPQVRFEAKIQNKSVVPLDFSGGGMKFATSDFKQMKKDDFIHLDLKIMNKYSLQLQAQIRHIKADTRNEKLDQFGVEFIKLNAQQDSMLFAIAVDLHRLTLKDDE